MGKRREEDSNGNEIRENILEFTVCVLKEKRTNSTEFLTVNFETVGLGYGVVNFNSQPPFI